MTHFKKQIQIQASKENAWKALANLGDVHKFHPGVSKSYHTSDRISGIGATRICELYPMGKVEEIATSFFWT